MSAPEIRFPEFKEPWRPTVAGAAFKHSRARGEAGLPIYSVTLDRGMVRRDSLDRHMESDAADGQNLRAQPGDVVYNMMRMWQGAVGVAPEECMVSPAYVVLRPTKGTNPRFFSYWFQNSRVLHKLGAYSHGLTKDRLRLYPDDFAKIPLNLPSRAEQDRIAAFFEGIDAKLAALREKADGLRQFKTGLMQRLFSQELRFTRDDGTDFPDWEEKKFGDVFVERSQRGNPIGELLSVTLRSGIRKASEVDRAQEASSDRSNYKIVCCGDIAYNSMRMWQGASGLSNYDGIVSPAYTVMAFRGDHCGKFWSYLLKNPEVINLFRRYSQGLTSDTWNLKFPILSRIRIKIPSVDEQKKISSALIAVDSKIDAVTDQITHMETFKKGLLQKMFV